MRFRVENTLVYAIWATLGVAIIASLFLAQWEMGFVALATLLASLVPSIMARRFGIRLPMPFLAGVILFIFATLFLGEAFDFYERYRWWDVLMHGFSAIGLGLAGFIFVFVVFEGDKYAAPAWAIAFIAFCLAMTMGVFWEIFEYAMDTQFGLNMQKSGLPDTMGDLIVNAIGATIGAGAAFLYLKGREKDGLAALIADFVHKNRRLFRRLR